MRLVLLPLLLAACAPVLDPARPLLPSEHGQALLAPLIQDGVLLDLAGAPARLPSLRGRAGTVIVLTASFCDPAALGNLLRQAAVLRPQGVEIVVISLDHDQRSFDELVRPPEVPILTASADARSSLRAETMLPTTVLLDAAGRVLRRYDGEVPVADLAADLERVPDYIAQAGASRRLVAALSP